MNEEQKRKLAKAKAHLELPNSQIKVIAEFPEAPLLEVQQKIEENQKAIAELLDRGDNSEHLIDANNKLVSVVSAVEQNSTILKQYIESSDKAQNEIAKRFIDSVEKFSKNLPKPKDMPTWVAKDSSIEKLDKSLERIYKQLGTLKAAPQSQRPEDFVPYRRVVKRGTRLEFDDHVPIGGGGGAVSILHNSWQSKRSLAQKSTPTLISNNAGAFGGYMVSNENASFVYLQIFDTASTPTVGTDLSKPFGIPPGAAANVEFTNGIKINSGIYIACTTTASGAVAPTTGLDMTILYE